MDNFLKDHKSRKETQCDLTSHTENHEGWRMQKLIVTHTIALTDICVCACVRYQSVLGLYVYSKIV